MWEHKGCSLLMAPVFSVHLERTSWETRRRQERLVFEKEGVKLSPRIMREKIELGTIGLSDSCKDTLESHGSDCKSHE